LDRVVIPIGIAGRYTVVQRATLDHTPLSSRLSRVSTWNATCCIDRTVRRTLHEREVAVADFDGPRYLLHAVEVNPDLLNTLSASDIVARSETLSRSLRAPADAVAVSPCTGRRGAYLGGFRAHVLENHRVTAVRGNMGAFSTA